MRKQLHTKYCLTKRISIIILLKFYFVCFRIGRHSKSLDTEKKICGYCHGSFSLVSVNGRTPRTTRKTPSSATPYFTPTTGISQSNSSTSHIYASIDMAEAMRKLSFS